MTERLHELCEYHTVREIKKRLPTFAEEGIRVSRHILLTMEVSAFKHFFKNMDRLKDVAKECGYSIVETNSGLTKNYDYQLKLEKA